MAPLRLHCITGWFVHLSVHTSIFLSITKLVNIKRMNRSNLHNCSTGQGHVTIDFWGSGGERLRSEETKVRFGGCEFARQYRHSWLPGKTHLCNEPLCVGWDTHSLSCCFRWSCQCELGTWLQRRWWERPTTMEPCWQCRHSTDRSIGRFCCIW